MSNKELPEIEPFSVCREPDYSGLKHGEKYPVKIASGEILKATFNLSVDGDEIWWVLGGKEISCTLATRKEHAAELARRQSFF